jgi:hypothetical protein
MAYRRLRSVSACLVTTVGLLALGLASAQADSAASTGWRIVKVVGVRGGISEFTTVTASGKTNAWAGGSLCPDPCSSPTATVVRWNGRSWGVFKLPAALSVGPSSPVVASSSATNTWIFAENGSNREYGVHITAGRETQVAFPVHVGISAAANFSPTNAWAFGVSGIGGSGTLVPYAAHYNGREWKHVALPVAPDGVSALSSGDLWVYGTTAATLNKSSAAFAAARWTGSRWHTVKLPNLHLAAGAFMQPDSVLALNQHDVWADGTLGKGQGIGDGVVLLNWNGKKWTSVRPRYALSQFDADITTDGHGGFWVSGYSSRAENYRGPYIYHYRAGRWTRVLAPTVDRGGAQFGNLAWIPGTQSVWGAAELLNAGGTQAVIYKFGP